MSIRRSCFPIVALTTILAVGAAPRPGSALEVEGTPTMAGLAAGPVDSRAASTDSSFLLKAEESKPKEESEGSKEKSGGSASEDPSGAASSKSEGEGSKAEKRSSRRRSSRGKSKDTSKDASHFASQGATSSSAPPTSPATIQGSIVRSLKVRSIGPAVMGGRVSTIAYDPQDPFTFYVGLGTGGVMKTGDNGGTFQGIFEKEAVAAIGAIAVSPSDPKILWVGTGEGNDRNSSSWGNGVYRSTDGGSTWTRAGLETSKSIPRIVLHPKDPKIAWVAALGDLWTPGGERGLYKTTDGGQTWKAVLQGPAAFRDRIGCGEVAIDPANPDVLYAALYARRRTPWSFESGPYATEGQDLGGLFKSTNGGASWKKLETGLPKATGRIGLDVYRKDPRIVYATVQSYEGAEGEQFNLRSRSGGVFRSEDGGETWTRMSPLNPRPFYFSQIRIDPTNDQRVYDLGFALHVSDDGGRSFREDFFQKVHPDCHELVIDPRNAKRVLLGTDGGAYQSYDSGKSWEALNRMAAGEFYRIALDDSVPYRICGGLQDNNNWVGPSRTGTKEGILNTDWINISGGDGFSCAFDSADPSTIYTESQEGDLYRFDLKNGEIKALRPGPAEGQRSYRFHWNAPLLRSEHTKGKLYLGGNRLFSLTDRGERWAIISPDLSTRNPDRIATVGSGAETYGVIYTVAESPIAAGILWAATDDGKLWITHDDGGAWKDLTAELPKPVQGQWISRIEAGRKDPKVLYMAVDAHRSGDFSPRLYRTADEGKTWQSLASNLPQDGPVKVIREDTRNPDLLYAGTEFGLFISFDRGGSWTRLKALPTVAVDDIAIHARDRDLVIATHGRSVFIVDDVTPLQEMTAEIMAKDAFLFPPKAVFGTNLMPGFADWTGKAIYRGENPPEGVLISVFVKEYTEEPVKIEIKNSSKQPVANLTAPGTPGINRMTWDLKPTKDLLSDYGGEGQKFVRSGDYEVTLTYGKTTQTQKLRVDISEGIETR